MKIEQQLKEFCSLIEKADQIQLLGIIKMFQIDFNTDLEMCAELLIEKFIDAPLNGRKTILNLLRGAING